MDKKTKRKLIFALVLLIVVVASGIAGYVALTYQAEAVTNDYTQNPKANAEEGADNSDDNVAILSANVKMFTAEEAADINGAISNVQITNLGLYMDVSEGTKFEDLGIGDVFFLEGGSNSPLGETYIGRIATISQKDSKSTYLIETPMIDEVFDVLDFDYHQVLTAESMSKVETLPGVTVSTIDDVASHFTALNGLENTGDFISLAQAGKAEYQAVPLADSEEEEQGLFFEIDVDLADVFDLYDPKKPDNQEKYDMTEANHINVYITDTGKCYHKSTCGYLSRSKHTVSLMKAVLDDYRPCFVCRPPEYVNEISEDSVSNYEQSLNLKGKIGLESIDFDVDYEWDIINGNGLENLAVSANGKFLAEAEVKMNMQYEFSGRTTTIKMPLADVKMEGLKEKIFPIAFVAYNGAITPVVSGNEKIRALTGAVPMTIGVTIYLDVSGNVTFSARAYINYSNTFLYENVVVKDGEWICDQNLDGIPDVDLGFESELKGDADIHLGGSVLLYVYNLNIVEVAIAKVGAEGEGMIKLDYSTDTLEGGENIVDGSYYARIYYKLGELNIKLKTNIKVWDSVKMGPNVDFSITCVNKTIAEWGEKNPTRFKPGLMTYSHITAADEEAVYYKDIDGRLIREAKGYRTTIYDKDFFTICGIDETYLYLMISNGRGTYDIHRVAKESGINKKIIEDVAICLNIDEKHIYYVSGFSATSIMRFDREYLKEDTFAVFGEDVTYMEEQGENFYVVTKENNLFASIFGGDTYCYLLNASGAVIGEYGVRPAVENYCLRDMDDYYEAVRIISSGYLRHEASEVYWMSRDKCSTVLTEGISGWNMHKIGIFTTQYSIKTDNTNEQGLPFQIVLYRSSDGMKINVVEVSSMQAFFTLCQSDNSDWYFFDQTDSELMLYVMEEDFSDKRVVKTFTLSEIPYNLSECGMTIMNNRIYFYAMPDDSTSKVLYRYDII